MDVFRACAIEAQATTEDIKDEMGIIASTFKSRHEKVSFYSAMRIDRLPMILTLIK